MKISEYGVEKLIEWEGFKTELYYDAASLPTIGVGHLLTKSEMASGKIQTANGPIRWNDGLTSDEVHAILRDDLTEFEATVSKYVKVELTQNQFDALVSFSFNVGSSAFINSTLLKRINSGDFDDVPNQFMRWVFAGGRRVKGLENRRRNEVGLWSEVA